MIYQLGMKILEMYTSLFPTEVQELIHNVKDDLKGNEK